jgi:hypothetical protein
MKEVYFFASLFLEYYDVQKQNEIGDLVFVGYYWIIFAIIL